LDLYSGTTTQFLDDVASDALTPKLQQRFFDEFRFRPAEGEVRAWRNSLSAMAGIVDRAGLHDHGVLVEYQLPLTSRRLDCMLTGHATDQPSAVLIELKQWDYVAPSWVGECVCTTVAGRERDVLHPSAQADAYRTYLADTNTAFAEREIRLDACAYLHNMHPEAAREIFAPRHRALLRRAPAFVREDADEFATYLAELLELGNGLPVLDRIRNGRYRPHKALLDHTAKAIRREKAWELLDEQRVSFNAVLTKVRMQGRKKHRTVFLIRGGPGTGKSVIAINLVAALSEEGLATLHTTGSRAFTENLRRAVGGRAAAQFKYFNSLSDADQGEIDVVISDEAHRLREYSWNWRTPRRLRTDTPQVEELVGAARTSVFFIDDLQVVRPDEVGSSDLIRETAKRLGADFVEFELQAQFRCGGSEAFVAWVENMFGLTKRGLALWDPREEFEFLVVDSPFELEAWVRGRSRGSLTARITAGFCWPWSNPEPDGTLVADVVLGEWAMPWNARPDAVRLQPGTPKSNYWATDPRGIEQVGCIYTAQGFEYDYAGVIFGRDLVHRVDHGWVGQPPYSHDRIVKRTARDAAEFTALVKNAYRVLLTRGLRGCAVYFADSETREFVLSRIDDRRRAGLRSAAPADPHGEDVSP
jgi:hypothetical protein